MKVGQFELHAFTAPDTTQFIEFVQGEEYAVLTLPQARALADALNTTASEMESK